MGDNKLIPRSTFGEKLIHDGDMFQIFHEDITLDDNATINFAFKTPALTTKEIHMVIDFATEIGGQVTVLEAATWTAKSGTAATPINLNRNSTNTSEILGNETTTTFTTANELALNVTTILTTNATTIESEAIYVHGGLRGMSEIILKADTTYVVLFTAEGASNFAHLKLRWYEYLPNTI